jgi:hypothetical protein
MKIAADGITGLGMDMVRTWYGHGAISFCLNQDFQDLRIHKIRPLSITNWELRITPVGSIRPKQVVIRN